MPLAMWIQHDTGVRGMAGEVDPESAARLSSRMNERLAGPWQLGLDTCESDRDHLTDVT